MATANTTIELNGKLYDARTGKIIGDAGGVPVSAAPIVKPATVKPPVSGVVMDGFTRRKAKPALSRTAPAHVKANLQKSTTLMRPAVKKPAKIVKSDITASKHNIIKKHDPARSLRAANTAKSSAVSRYSSPPVRIIKKSAHLPVASQANHAAAQRVAQLATSTETHVKQSVDIIEESLRNASAHLQQFDDSVKRTFLERFGFKNRKINVAALSVSVLLLVGFFGWQNAPNLGMRVAAAKSGVNANVPGYRPAGFGLSRDIQSQPGKVAVTFQSHTDDKKYTVTQTASSWSSDALLSNHVLASKQPFQTYQDEGKTVYIYDNSNATWVNGGIWYQVNGDANLTSDQLLRIANSF